MRVTGAVLTLLTGEPGVGSGSARILVSSCAQRLDKYCVHFLRYCVVTRPFPPAISQTGLIRCAQGPLIYYVRMILAIFDPRLPPCKDT